MSPPQQGAPCVIIMSIIAQVMSVSKSFLLLGEECLNRDIIKNQQVHVYAGARTALTRTFGRTLPDLELHSAGVEPHLSGSLSERMSDRHAHMDSFIRICG